MAADKREPILGWKLDPGDRAALLARFPPRYERTVADHITFGPTDAVLKQRNGSTRTMPAMPEADEAIVIGRADDGAGVEALVVEIAGTSDRWDGSSYHVTWSLDEGREAVESNAVIARCGFAAIAGAPPLRLTAASWP